ncbi:MAG: HEPN domain-containing protein [Rubrobacter sp.]|nr:HEPN domain-containing protein [Rubrobacter sp.]
MSEIEALFEKADRSFSAAEQLLTRGDTDFAVSRTYYGYFYVAEALLLSKGLSFSRHSQVISQYGSHFAKTEILDRRFHRLFRRAFSLRQTADYSTEPAPEPKKVSELTEEGKAFLREARSYVEERPPGQRP